MKKLLKSTRGMTLMEILVALSLLMIIIVGTTPVMLQAYDGLYTAGEYTQDTYEAKSEIENKLATRNTRNVYPGFTVNFNNLGEVATLNGRRAVSSLKGSLETLFTNARVRVAIISAKKVNDDYAGTGYHEVVIQTTNLDFGTTDKDLAQAHLSINQTDNIADGGKIVDGYLKKIDLTFLIPNKQADPASIYSNGNGDAYIAKVRNISVEPITGRITVEINGFDFTQSPIKIMVAYLDENDKRQMTEEYLYVDTPTIIAAGKTGAYDYYTSPGVVQKSQTIKDDKGNVIGKESEEVFEFYGRTMRIGDNATVTSYTDPLHSSTVKIRTGISAIKDGTIIKNVTWVDNDEEQAVGPYYVLTGTNGAIYRTYSFTQDYTDAELYATVAPADKEVDLQDRYGTIVYPAVWGGDKAHQFGYSTYGKSMVYDFTNENGNDRDNGCWYTESGRDTGVGHPSANAYSTSAEYSYYYNGWGQTYNYMSQKSRKISYILTEHGLSLRLGGYLKGEADHHKNYNLMWENLNNINHYSDYTYNTDFTDKSRWDRRDFYHPTFGSSVVTAVWGSDNHDETQSQDCPLYLDDKGDTDGDMFADIYWGNIRIKYLSNMPLDYFHASGRRGNSQDGQSSSVRFLNHQQWSTGSGESQKTYNVYDPKITVTDAVYLPALGSMFYVGTVAADAYLQQNDNLANKDGWVKEYEFQPADSHGAITTYLVRGNEDGTATEVHKYSYQSMAYGDYDFEWDHYTALVTDYYLAGKATMTEAKTSDSGNAAEAFYVTRPNTTASKLFTDVSFTLGFSSNREYVYSEIVYGKVDGSLKETYKSYEHYYFKSHYKGDTKHIPNVAIVNNDGNSTLYSQTAGYINQVDNDYYNVWFPGEMYNITQVATKEGVTVGTGYTVSGSTYQFVLGSNHTNTSTALGGIFNDGVLACSIDNNETSFENLLYYKDNISFDNSYLSNKDGYKTAYTSGYGTHSRDSVQFTAVDIGIQYTNLNGGSSEKATYYAYYADNKGRVFRSKVATRTSTSTSSGTPTKVSYISDALNSVTENGTTKKVFYTPSTVPSSDTIGYMEQLILPGSTQFADLFDAITSITIEGNMIFISGKPNQANKTTINGKGVPSVVGMVDENTGEIEWIIIYCEATIASDCWIEDLLVLDGYLYLAGRYVGPDSVTTHDGFIAAVSVAEVRSILMSRTTSTSIEHIVDLMCVNVPDEIYAIDGHK